MNKYSHRKVIKTKLLVICSLSAIFGLWLILSCERLEIKRLIRVQTIDSMDMRSTYAIVYGRILDIGDEGLVSYGHCVSKIKNFTGSVIYSDLKETDDTLTYSSIIENLEPGTYYFVRTYAKNTKDEVYGNIKQLRTKNPVEIEWEVCLGGSASEWGKSAAKAVDNSGYFISGQTYSNDYDVSGLNGGADVWVVKIDNTGNIVWQNSLGGSDDERAKYISATADGGCIIAAEVTCNDGDVTGFHGGMDYWILKLNSAGILEWQKCLGGTDWEDPNCIMQTNDQGYVVTGKSLSNDGDATGNHGDFDFWTVKLDEAGTIQWQVSHGGSGIDGALFVRQTTDDGYILAGRTWSNDGDVSGNHGEDDFWVVKLDASATLQWQRCLGGSSHEGAKCIVQTADEGYLVTGGASSSDQDVSENKGERDYWIVKLNSSGSIQWEKSFGGSFIEQPLSIIETSDEGCIVAGYANSDQGDIEGHHGICDGWIIKLSSSGVLQWQKCLGGSDYDEATDIIHTSDDGYLVTGGTWSTDGDISNKIPERNSELWVVKLKEN